MHFDVFFSISQTPVDGVTPSEAEMFRNFFEQVEAADELGYDCAWLAEAHLSTEVQKGNRRPVIPHWQGEVGLNTDVLQMAHKVFARTSRIEVGSAIMNLLVNGGPVAHAERIAAFASLHGLDPAEQRRVRIGFSGGRFEFMSRAFGFEPRDPVEETVWPAQRGQTFAEAAEIFLRLLNGETLSSEDIAPRVLTRASFRSDGDWAAAQAAWVGEHGGELPTEIPLKKWFVFEALKIVPAEWRQELVDLVVGSHDPVLQVELNRWRPVKVFNLSITRPEIIDATHARLSKTYNLAGGPWKREYMPRTVMVFVNEQPGLSPAERSAAAKEEARKALSAYWHALEGTIDPAKIERAANNAVIGNAEEVAAQVAERFHPDDRAMLWFDFFNHDSARVVDNMRAFMEEVVPRVDALQAAAREGAGA